MAGLLRFQANYINIHAFKSLLWKGLNRGWREVEKPNGEVEGA